MERVIHWPERYDPAVAPVQVRNEIEIPAPAPLVWAWLVRASLWPSWYPNAHNVRINDGADIGLSAGARFTWRTFGVSIRSTVLEFVPFERIAWNGFGIGVDVYHAWLITPTPAGSHVLTEETQYGWAARIGSLLLPNRMSRYHQIWIEELSKSAQRGLPV